MSLRILGPADFVSMPWKNGQGVTTELAVSRVPGVDGFDWRISTATVANAGPFSSFPGIDRSLAIVRGGSLALDVEGQGAVMLTTASGSFAFAGELAVTCAPTLADTGEPLDDFNVMTRRTAWRHSLVRRVLPPSTSSRWADLPVGGIAFLYCCAGAVRVAIDGVASTPDVTAGHALCVDVTSSFACELFSSADVSADVFLVTLSRI